MARKAQAAMEFLMTYGWAILVVLAAIGALAYFGVLSPDTLLPERCTGPSGLDCVDKASISFTGNVTIISLKNNLGYSINVTPGAPWVGMSGGTCSTAGESNHSIYSVNGQSVDLTVPASLLPKTIGNNENIVLYFNCTPSQIGRFKEEFTFTYVNIDNGVAHSATVSIRGKSARTT